MHRTGLHLTHYVYNDMRCFIHKANRILLIIFSYFWIFLGENNNNHILLAGHLFMKVCKTKAANIFLTLCNISKAILRILSQQTFFSIELNIFLFKLIFRLKNLNWYLINMNPFPTIAGYLKRLLFIYSFKIDIMHFFNAIFCLNQMERFHFCNIYTRILQYNHHLRHRDASHKPSHKVYFASLDCCSHLDIQHLRNKKHIIMISIK